MFFSLRTRSPFDNLRDKVIRRECEAALAEFKDPALRWRREAAQEHGKITGHTVRFDPNLACLRCSFPES